MYSKSLWTSIPSEHLPKVLQCFLGIATLLKMSNMLHIAVDHEGAIISQASQGHWDKVQRTRSQLFFVPMCSPEGHQTFETLKSKQRGLLNFYLHQVEGNREINLCRSFLIFEVPNFHSSWQHATTLWLPRQWCLVKEKLSPYDFQQFNISSCTKCISEHPMLVHSIQSLKVPRNFSEDD